MSSMGTYVVMALVLLVLNVSVQHSMSQQSDNDNHADQMNPNNDEYGGGC